VESVGHPGDESDLGVDRFGAGVGQPVVDGGEEAVAVPGDATLQGDVFGGAAAAGLAEPGVEGGAGFLGW
jgi:hypothetical protein